MVRALPSSPSNPLPSIRPRALFSISTAISHPLKRSARSAIDGIAHFKPPTTVDPSKLPGLEGTERTVPRQGTVLEQDTNHSPKLLVGFVPADIPKGSPFVETSRPEKRDGNDSRLICWPTISYGCQTGAMQRRSLHSSVMISGFKLSSTLFADLCVQSSCLGKCAHANSA